MGIPPFTARWKAPFLNGNRLGTSSLCRVPSANMSKDVRRAFIPSPAASSDRCAFALFPLSTKTVPDKFINGPSTGFHLMDFFAMIEHRLGYILETQDKVNWRCWYEGSTGPSETRRCITDTRNQCRKHWRYIVTVSPVSIDINCGL